MVKNGDFVIPGEFLGISEEFIPGEGAYEEDGKVFSSATGEVNVDTKERRINVVPKTDVPPVPKNGDIVIGRVWDIKPQMVIVDIIKPKGKNRAFPGNTKGTIHISRTRSTYVSDLDREFKVGDIIYAKVSNADKTQIQLTTIDREMGVVKAFCSICNTPLVQEKNSLKCRVCDRTETRRTSSMYGSGEA